MEIKLVKIDEIIPYENNPRNNEEAVEPVMKSIKEFGFKVPMVIDKENIIVTGHTRYKAAKKLEIDKVPCIIADDLSEDQIKAYRLADNKVAEFAEWDFNILNLELNELIDFDMSIFGFDLDIGEEEKKTIEREDLSDEIGETFEVIIECDNENEQQELFEKLTEEGYTCRVLIL